MNRRYFSWALILLHPICFVRTPSGRIIPTCNVFPRCSLISTFLEFQKSLKIFGRNSEIKNYNFIEKGKFKKRFCRTTFFLKTWLVCSLQFWWIWLVQKIVPYKRSLQNRLSVLVFIHHCQSTTNGSKIILKISTYQCIFT